MSVAAIVAGAVCGVLSGLGVGGGTALMVWMTAICGTDPAQAQGINLLYFLPTAACALIFHAKHGLLRPRVILCAALGGAAVAALTAWLTASLETALLRRLFGGFLILVGLVELFGKHDADKNDK